MVVANQLISLGWLQGHPLFFAQAQLLDSLKSQNSLCLLLNDTRSGRKKEETMPISLNSAVGFNSTLQTKYHHVSRPKAASLGMLASRIQINGRRRGLFVSAVDNDRLVTDTGVKGHGGAESSIYDNQLSAVNSPIEDSPVGNNVGEESGPQTSGASNGSTISVDMKSRPKRSPLTARERLKAARVISRYTESKTPKSEMGRKVLDALRESDKGKKRSGLPEAPENLFDDSKRGLPKEGWTFQFPGGSELFFIVVSFVLISTIMFATTYIVWKVGAIHFDEY